MRKPSAAKPATLARKGQLEKLARLEPARDAYKWLCAAGDFGHEEFEDFIADVRETTSLRYDDSGFEFAAAHWELAVAYLEGAEGLPVDLELAATHLGEAFEDHRTLEAINAGAATHYDAEVLLERLPERAKAVLRDGLAGNEFNRAIRHIEIVRRLTQLGNAVPSVILHDAARELRRSIAKLCPPPDAQSVGGSDPLDQEIAFLEETVAKTQAALEVLRAERTRRA